jgi:hypothetical protein
MMTLDFYLELGTDQTSLAAAALLADQADHALVATCVALIDLATNEDATGHALEGAILRRAATWLQRETAAHRIVRDELVARSGLGDELAQFLKERRAAAVASREASAPLFKLCRQYLRLALHRAGLDQAEDFLATGLPGCELACDAVLAFLAANKGATDV